MKRASATNRDFHSVLAEVELQVRVQLAGILAKTIDPVLAGLKNLVIEGGGAGLFVYDIFWVFFTPVMVSVAKSFDAPIKYQKGEDTGPNRFVLVTELAANSIFVALALRFDVSRGKDSQYFKSAFLGYTAGLVLTIIVMNWFQAAQPALLYIVPAAIGFLAAHVAWNGEVKPLMEFDESKTAASSQEGSETSSSKKVE
ncbi:Minor histocompatibility antigen H13 [Populus alba x Populus x berolinensis]|nr:Minor histocompatibility antigen H13 [Populus alba x Populus x berolinensis]